MAVCNYNCVELGEHERLSCLTKTGGSNALAIIECDHTFTDFSDPAQWVANIASGKARLIEGIRVGIPEPAEVEGDNLVGCGPDTVLDGFDWTITFRDGNVSASNHEFFESLNQRAFLVAVLICAQKDGTEEIWLNDFANARAIVKPGVPESNKEKQLYNGRIFWNSLNFPEIIDAPAGVFNQ